MSSPISEPTRPPKWIVTTCRGRVDHLRYALPSWIEHLPDWEPIVVCCDDPVATEYAAGELMLARRGICVQVAQGKYFNKLEAIRLGAAVAALGFRPDGRLIDKADVDHARGCSRDVSGEMIAQLDADTIATARTADGLATVDRYNVGIAGWGTKDDVGLIVAPLDVFLAALETMPVGWFEGYGPEDSALRVACWVQIRGPFVKLPMCWRRIQHTDSLRSKYHSRAVAGAVRKNQEVMQELIRRLVPQCDVEQMRAECLAWPQRGHGP